MSEDSSAQESEFDAVQELISKFVRRELMPLENEFLKRRANGITPLIPDEDAERLNKMSQELGLWGLDAPADLGGMDLPSVAMVRIWEELGRTPLPFDLPPDSPNLRMLAAIGTPTQKAKYLQPYIEGKITSGIAISEPGAGGDPTAMKTRAERDGDEWVLNGRKIWISHAKGDFVIVIARVGNESGRHGITSFIVEKDTPGFSIEREIPMVGTFTTYEIVFEDCRIPLDALLGSIGQGYEPMQLRLRTRRLEMGAKAIGMASRALEMLCEHASQRVTFGVPLSDRQAIQWWIADIATRIHACRLMIRDAAVKVDQGNSAPLEISMIKVFATELAYDALDHAMQTLGALGMTQETVLYPMWQLARLMRIYEGPSEVHRQSIARRILGKRA